MNVETADRLTMPRKKRGYSQEQLAEKLGVSRQAVSKWERAEASPDTDNLIALAKIYEISLDELLGYREHEEKTESEDENEESDKKSYVNISWKGIHVEDGNDSVHLGWKEGIHVKSANRDSVHIDKNGSRVFVNGEEKYKKTRVERAIIVTFSIMVFIAFMLIGTIYGAWHPAWLLFLFIPVVESFIVAVKTRNAHVFAYPVAVTILFLILGFFKGIWHPAWVVFLTIPIYYIIFPKGDEKEEDEA